MKPSPRQETPRVAVLTGSGRGALAAVRVWGPGALAVADAAFRPARGKPLRETPAGRLRLGRLGAGRGDEVVALIVSIDPPEVEIQCHGGPAAVNLVVDALVALGAERRQPVAWVRQASASLIEAEAEVDLVRAPTLRTAEILLEQAQGALSAAVRGVLDQLATHDHDSAREGLATLRRHASIGLRLVEGWRVVLVGRPNVGKSRLLNALAGYGRSIVDPTPGTTRDVVTVMTAFDGWPIELADTAGLRAAGEADPIEAAGIQAARTRQQAADLRLIVLDRSEPWTALDHEIQAMSGGAAPDPSLIVASKADLPPAWEPIERSIITISAERGDGLDTLIAAMARRVVPRPTPPGAPVPFRPAHLRRIERALDALDRNQPEDAARTLTDWLARKGG